MSFKWMLPAGLLATGFAVVGPAAAQIQPNESQSLFESRNQKYETSLEQFYQERSVLRNASPQVLDGRLDPDLYVVGPGDGFTFMIWGGRSDRYEVQVNPMGTVVIPTVGEVAVDGLTLHQALERIKTRIRENYENIDFSLNLTQLRRFRIYMTGEIASKGTFFVQGSDRLADVVEIAGGVSKWADNTRIEVQHADGGMATFDLSAFLVSGDQSQNPTLNGGDVVHVPPIDLKGDYVFFEGTLAGQSEGKQQLNRILRPDELPSELQGVFPLKPAETLGQFLLRVGAMEKTSDLDQIMVVRHGDVSSFNALQPEGIQALIEFPLVTGDRVLVRTRRDRVYVRGEVRQPGAYPYLADRTTSDYAGVAGVMDSGASPDDYFVIRADTGEKLKGKGISVYNGDTVVIPQRRRENMKDYVQILLPIATLAVTVVAISSR